MKILHSQLTTPDGTVLVSRYRHDYVSYTDANGKFYFLDGGNSYIRSSLHADANYVTLSTEDPHIVVRNYLEWGTYGINGDEPLHQVTLANMNTGHIKAVLDSLHSEHPYIPYYKEELLYRDSLCNSNQTEES